MQQNQTGNKVRLGDKKQNPEEKSKDVFSGKINFGSNFFKHENKMFP